MAVPTLTVLHQDLLYMLGALHQLVSGVPWDATKVVSVQRVVCMECACHDVAQKYAKAKQAFNDVSWIECGRRTSNESEATGGARSLLSEEDAPELWGDCIDEDAQRVLGVPA